jgi:hypothetical protein
MIASTMVGLQKLFVVAGVFGAVLVGCQAKDRQHPSFAATRIQQYCADLQVDLKGSADLYGRALEAAAKGPEQRAAFESGLILHIDSRGASALQLGKAVTFCRQAHLGPNNPSELANETQAAVDALYAADTDQKMKQALDALAALVARFNSALVSDD